MVSIRERTDTYVIDLDSRNWHQSTDRGLFLWSSLGTSVALAGSQLDMAGAASNGMEGNWSAILVKDDALVLVSDLVRSHALFYARIGRKWVVSDSVEKMRMHMDHWLLDVGAAEVFEKAGFTLNERTLVRDVSIVESASEVRLSFGKNDADVSFWCLPTYADPGVQDAEEFSSLYSDALDDAFGELLGQTGDRQLVIPLSGGLDSRLVGVWLRKLRAPNVLAFTYGREGSKEASIAQTVAQKLGIEFVFVPTDVSDVRSLWFSEATDAFRAHTWSASALPHIQDWYALYWLKDNGVVEDDAVFLPGHTPVGAMHNLELLEREAPAGAIAHALVDHHTLNPREKPQMAAATEFRRAVSRAFSQVPQAGRRTQNVIEWFNYRERQSKYINNSMAGYEFFGWDWALPLYWRKPLSVWFSGAEELTAARDWYRGFVDDVYAQQTGDVTQVDYFLPPAESSSIPFRDQIVSFSRKSGLNRAFSWVWALKVQARHPLGLEAFVNARSDADLFASLVKNASLMRIWAGGFLANRWGSRKQILVPSPVPEEGRKPTLLIISYSDIGKDARLRKQVGVFTSNYDVTVVGHGEPFEVDAELILFPPTDTLRTEQMHAALLHTKQYALAQKLEANNVAARKLLKGRQFDAVVTNDIEPVGMAIDLFGADKVHADLHEYYPGLQDEDLAWVKLRQPYYRWMLANNVARAASVTTVSQTIAQRYRDEFGFESQVVQNARPDQGLMASPVEGPIRLVHAGASLPNRNIEQMMEAVAAVDGDATIDFYLTGEGTEYHAGLERLADELGDRIRVHPPLPPDDIVATLNKYDVGVHILPPFPTNNLLALPNKFFDFVQARLGIIVGPTPEMQARVRAFGLGAVTEDFSKEALTKTIEALDGDKVRRWKQNADLAAAELDVSKMLNNWRKPVERIVGSNG